MKFTFSVEVELHEEPESDLERLRYARFLEGRLKETASDIKRHWVPVKTITVRHEETT